MDDFDDIVRRVIHNPSPTEITNSAAKYLNSLPADRVVPALIRRFETDPDELARSRTLDALMRIEDFDKVGFLIEYLDKVTDVDWRYGIATRLADFRDPRARQKFVDILLHDEASDMRFLAAESLGHLGNESSIEALEHAAEHDTGTDWEGIPVSRAAREALEDIRGR